tara:strand:+ start:441 stop:764 length:324 start_codon:yes stop_codon:yes gene_type:complete
MKKKIKILTLFFIILFLYSCGTAKDALVGKKRSEQGDEFLIDKKNPLSMPPDFDKLPEPGEAKSAITNENNNSEVKDLLLKDNENDDNNSESSQSSSIEISIIEKIK